jgi:hypothetical protein
VVCPTDVPNAIALAESVFILDALAQTVEQVELDDALHRLAEER